MIFHYLKNELLDDIEYKTFIKNDLVGFLNKENEKKMIYFCILVYDLFYDEVASIQ